MEQRFLDLAKTIHWNNKGPPRIGWVRSTGLYCNAVFERIMKVTLLLKQNRAWPTARRTFTAQGPRRKEKVTSDMSQWDCFPLPSAVYFAWLLLAQGQGMRQVKAMHSYQWWCECARDAKSSLFIYLFIYIGLFACLFLQWLVIEIGIFLHSLQITFKTNNVHS